MKRLQTRMSLNINISKLSIDFLIYLRKIKKDVITTRSNSLEVKLKNKLKIVTLNLNLKIKIFNIL